MSGKAAKIRLTEEQHKILEDSPGIQTFVIQLAEPGGYLPTARAARHGGYGAVIQSCRMPRSIGATSSTSRRRRRN